MLENCQNCVFYSPTGNFRQIKNMCMNASHQKAIHDLTDICSSFLVSKRKKEEFLKQVKLMETEQQKKQEERHIQEEKEKEERKKIKIQIYLSLQDYCREYKFVFEMQSDGIMIVSQQDTWYAEVEESWISLYHKNKKGETSEYHHQKNFSLSNAKGVIRTIAKHDDHVAFHRNTAWMKKA